MYRWLYLSFRYEAAIGQYAPNRPWMRLPAAMETYLPGRWSHRLFKSNGFRCRVKFLARRINHD
ncbi:hypothetical protein BGLA2_160006 [Burkholderia gladioli]|nr:hypothetical protein BGLA2_160006 [Burkholderia gladioli]